MSAQRWRNWCGLVECAPASIERPADVDAVARLVRESASAGRKLRVAGSGHSFTPLVATPGTLLHLDRLSGLLDVDRAKARAAVWAGTSLHDLGGILDGHGLAMENLGDIDRQTLAGALSTGTHGTGAAFGSLSTQASALTLVSGEGEIVECSEESSRDVFKAAQVSLGCLGVIVKTTLRLRPSFRLRYARSKESLEDCAAKIPAYRDGNRHFELYWFPHTETVQVKLLNETEEPAHDSGLVKRLNDLVLENAAFGLLSRACRLAPALCAPASRLSAALVSTGVEVGPSYRVFATTRLVRFYEMEYALPSERGLDALREIKAWIERERIAVHFPLELRFVKGDDIPLSPAYGRDTAFVAVHMYRGMEFERYFDGAESIFRNNQGRPHWGKMHGLAAKELSELYPLWDAFHEVRRRLDPRGVFMTPYLERLFGSP